MHSELTDRLKEDGMMILFKWIALTLLGGLTWLVGKYTVEYFKPFKR